MRRHARFITLCLMVLVITGCATQTRFWGVIRNLDQYRRDVSMWRIEYPTINGVRIRQEVPVLAHQIIDPNSTWQMELDSSYEYVVRTTLIDGTNETQGSLRPNEGSDAGKDAGYGNHAMGWYVEIRPGGGIYTENATAGPINTAPVM